MLGQRVAGVMKQVAPKVAYGAFDAHALMHIFADPLSFAAVIEANFAIGVPPAVTDPAAEILRQTRERITIAQHRVLLQGDDLRRQFRSDFFVGIKGESPVMSRATDGEVLLCGVTTPGFFEHARAE